MTQSKFELWFVLNLVGIVIGFLLAMCNDVWLADVVLGISLLSFIPCLYVGNKPCK